MDKSLLVHRARFVQFDLSMVATSVGVMNESEVAVTDTPIVDLALIACLRSDFDGAGWYVDALEQVVSQRALSALGREQRVPALALLQRLAAVRGRLSLCADQAAAAKWWLSMPMASVSAEGPMPKALSTRRTSPLMPGCRHQGRACPLRRARMTSNPLIVA